jgi:signal transduction histidine kinase
MFRWKFANKLSGRVFLTFAVALIAISMIFGLFTSYFGGQLVIKSSANELRVLSVVLSELIQNQFVNLEGSLEDIVGDEAFQFQLESGSINHSWLETYLRNAAANHPHLTDLMIYDLDGNCIGATDPDWYKIRGRSEAFFKNGLESFNFPPIYGAESLGRVQLATAPIISDDNVIGVIVAIIELKDIYALMDQKIGLTETTDAFLLDEDLRFITAGRAEYPGLVESHLVSTTLASHLKDEFWVGEYEGANGDKVLGTALKIPGYSWYVVVERNYSDVVKELTAIQRAVLLVTVGLICIFIVASLGLSRSVTRPLYDLVGAARKIASGTYNEPIRVNPNIEEVAFIGAELERMRRQVASSQERLKERLTESEQLRIESERLAAIGSLAASLAHEIRNPLNAMSLLLSRLQYSLNDDTRKLVMGDLFGEIGRLDRLVTSILDYARPVQVDRRMVDVGTILSSVVDLYETVAQSKGVALSMESLGSVKAFIDPDRLKQCIVNLVKNSLDATDRGGVVKLFCHVDQDDLVIEVSDSGSGIPESARPKLFTPFFTTKESGTGLGLSAVHKIVSSHGGRIAVVDGRRDAEAGQQYPGVTFVITLPRHA